jgi:serine phosphatase RsbU (regulator of sigma subunit)
LPVFGQLEVIPLAPADTFAVYQHKQKAIAARSQHNDLKEESRYYNLIAFIYWEHNMFEKAADWYKKSLALNQQLNNQNGISMINSNLGLIYSDLHHYETAYEYFQQTLAYRKMVKDKVGTISAMINMSVVLNNLSRFDESLDDLDEALTLARELNDMEQMLSCYGMLSETYEKAKQPEKAYYYFEYYRSFHEKILSEKEKITKEKITEAELQLRLVEVEKANKELQLRLATVELTEKEEELSISLTENESLYKKYTKAELEKSLLEKENLLKESTMEKQRSEQRRQQASIIFLLTILLLILAALGIFIRLYRQKNRMNVLLQEQNLLISNQKTEIELQQQDLTDSINYALRIQKAALKKNMEIDIYSVMDDFFIFYRPTAIVSGDFYWFTLIDNKLILVAADCTGHGVPGAFMSLIGMSLLNQIVEGGQTYMPDEILVKLNAAIIDKLDQKNNTNFDGMDAAVCTIDLNANKLYFAGAYRPIVIVNNGEVVIAKGNTSSLGGSQEMFEQMGKFDVSTFDLAPSLRFYLFSDGYCDQANERYKKIGSKRLYNLLGQTANLPMKEQYTAIEAFFDNWRDGFEQIDDVMVLGFSLKE